ncbi:MAG: LysR family transcriptional regulator [Kangiellaceae bacterium]|nr:LysR family transcriptional regulator [Kangiellaceae bacterium]
MLLSNNISYTLCMAYPLTFRQLEIFNSVARHLSYTRAAEELYLSQPAVSMQVKQMENLLDANLTEKIGKKLFLTEIGIVMFDYSTQVMASKIVMEETLASMQGKEKGHLRLAVPETANQFITLLLAQFRKLHPGITFELQIHNREGLLRCLKVNKADLAIMGQTPSELELSTQSFMNNPLVIIAPPNHPLCKRKSIRLNDLTDIEFVVREIGSGTRIAMQNFFRTNNVQLKTSMEMPNNEAIKQAVSAGLGFGIVSLHTLQQELELKQVKVLPVKEMPIMRIWYVVHQGQKIITPAMEVFKQFVIENAQNIWIKKYPQLRNQL